MTSTLRRNAATLVSWSFAAHHLSTSSSCSARVDQKCAQGALLSSWRVLQSRGLAASSQTGRDGRAVLYKGRWMVPFRALTRLKIFQLGGIAALAIPLGTFLSEGGISTTSLGISGALLLGCGISAGTLNYFSRRYVGELSLISRPERAEPELCISVLDFWGNREDIFVHLTDLQPPLKDLTPGGVRRMALQPLIPVHVDGQRQFYMSLRFGVLPDKTALKEILQGTHALQKPQGDTNSDF